MEQPGNGLRPTQQTCNTGSYWHKRARAPLSPLPMSEHKYGHSHSHPHDPPYSSPPSYRKGEMSPWRQELLIFPAIPWLLSSVPQSQKSHTQGLGQWSLLLILSSDHPTKHAPCHCKEPSPAWRGVIATPILPTRGTHATLERAKSVPEVTGGPLTSRRTAVETFPTELRFMPLQPQRDATKWQTSHQR